MSDHIKHECGIALIHLKKPLGYYQKKYGITFPIVIKSDLSIKLFLKYGKPTWNFTKYLFDKEHNFVGIYENNVKPETLLNYV